MISNTSLHTGAAAPHAAQTGPAAPPAPPKTRRVIDAPMRVFHALFALSFAGAYITAESEHWRLLHVTLGYTLGALLGFRVLYGLIGPRQARLTQLWRRLAGGPAWIRSMASAVRTGATVPWRQGQNLTMALVLVALLTLTLPLVISGWGTFSDAGEVFEDLHEAMGDAMLALVLTHLGLIAALSLLRRQNVAAPMLTGHMPGAGPSLVQHNRGWLGGLLLVGTLAFSAWLWQDHVSSASAAPQRPAQARATLGQQDLSGDHHRDDD